MAAGPPAGPAPPPSLQFASLYVGDLNHEVTEATLYEAFQAAGSVASCRICRDSITRKSLGYGYVNYYNVEDAEKALETLNYQSIKGRSCRVMWSQRDKANRSEATGNIFVKNLDVNIDNKALHDTFQIFGRILSCKVSADKEGKSKGYGFVHFEAEEAAKQAIERVNGMKIGDAQVFVGPFMKRAELENSSGDTFTNLYIKNLPSTWNEEALTAEFTKFGEIVSSVVMQSVDAKRFALVNFRSPDDAKSAIAALHRKPIASYGDEPAEEEAAKPDEEATKPIEEAPKPAAEDSETVAKEPGPSGEAAAEAEDDAAVEAAVTAEEQDFPANLLYVQRAQTRAERREQIMKERAEKRGGQRDRPQGVRLCVRNLNEDMTSEKLKEMFTEHGQVLNALAKTDDAGLCRGLGFVVMSSMEEATKAVTETHLKMVDGKPLNVGLAEKKKSRQGEGAPGSPSAGDKADKGGKGKGGEDKKGKGKGKGKKEGKGKGKGADKGSVAAPRPPGPFPLGLPPPLPPGVIPGMIPGLPGALPPGFARPLAAFAAPGAPRPATYSLPPAMSAGRPPATPGATAVAPGAAPMPPGTFAPMPATMPGLAGMPSLLFPPSPLAGIRPGSPMHLSMEAMLRAGVRPPSPAVPGMPVPPVLPIGSPTAAGAKAPPITREMLVQLPPQAQKQQLGERLFPLISKYRADLAGKITGMMLELDNSELIRLLENEKVLKRKIDEAVKVLDKQR